MTHKDAIRSFHQELAAYQQTLVQELEIMHGAVV
jgi:hypothetical protein